MSADDIVLHKPQPVELDVELIKRTICKGADDLELKLFLNQCQRTGLDPFARQIHAVKRWDASVGKEVMQAMIGIDGFRLIADRSGRYVPGGEPTFCYDKEGFLLKATAYVNVYRQGTWHEVSDSALYAEYVQTKKSGEPNSMWAKMPHSQLAKCAESRCLRKAFPAELSGLYTSEEMAQSDNPVPSVYIPHANGQRVDTSTGEIVETQVAAEPTEEEKAAAKAEGQRKAKELGNAIKAKAKELGYLGPIEIFSRILAGLEADSNDKPLPSVLKAAYDAADEARWTAVADQAFDKWQNIPAETPPTTLDIQPTAEEVAAAVSAQTIGAQSL